MNMQLVKPVSWKKDVCPVANDKWLYPIAVDLYKNVNNRYHF